MDIEEKIKEKLAEIIKELGVEVEANSIVIEHSKVKEHGDLATNVAMKLARDLHKAPSAIADDIIAKFKLDEVSKVEKAGPGFINFFLASDSIQSLVKEVIAQGEHFCDSEIGKGTKVCCEYVSANPTGTLHLGHARGAAFGDSITRLFKKCHYDITREYYINDAGNQINNLALSLHARYLEQCGEKGEIPENGYHGKEIIEFAKGIKEKYGDSKKELNDENFEFFKDEGTKIALNNIKADLHEFRVDFDVFTSEKAIRKAGKVEKVKELLKPYCYEEDGATFLNTTKDGDDKDRVIVKKDGCYTYLLPDIAYHKDKFDRGFDRLIDLFGADHHGYICRLKSSMKSLGYDPDKLDVSLVQMVKLFKDGQEYKMSKRTGNSVSMKELVEEVGVDAVRYFFNSRAGSQHLDFDLDLAKTMGTSNPVYYCQYAHARLETLLEMGLAQGFNVDETGSKLVTDSELDLIKVLGEYKNVVEDACLTLSPYKVTNYVRKLASSVNDFYTKCRVLDKDNKELTEARLGLCKASEIVLKDALGLLGVSAPSHM